jgi:site-specific recombinase XerD
MLERYYVRPQIVDRIRAVWLGPAIDRYVNWLSERHASKDTIRQAVRALIEFNDYARARGANAWEDLPPHLEPFVVQWMQKHGAWCRSEHDRIVVRSHGRVPVEQMLRLVLPGFVGTDRRVRLPFLDRAPGFFSYLGEERGLRQATIHSYVHNLRVFEAYLQRVGVVHLRQLAPAFISAFLTERAQRLSALGIGGCAGALRVFLRYCYRQGIIPTDLSRAVPRGRRYKQASIPRAIAWADVQRVLEGVDRRSTLGKRDYALLLLLVSYGLRAREIAAMQLDDLDWKQARLRVSPRKGGHSTIYPLSATVGEAIIDYLRAGRPAVDDRHLFLVTKMPYSPMNHWTVSGRVASRLHAAGVQVPRAGSHTLRHTCVQRLVDADVPFKVIGDYVGHAREESTMVYGKVALHRLRQLAIGDAEEAL